MTDTAPDFEWLLPARDAIQHDLLDLHKLLAANGVTLKERLDLLAAFSTLVGAAFSLWRAAFLSDIKQSGSDILDSTKELLLDLLTTNAVLWSSDRKLKNWMFGYYLQSALDRLARARDLLGIPSIDPTLRDFERVRAQGLYGIQDSPRPLWDILREALVVLHADLKHQVESASATGSHGA